MSPLTSLLVLLTGLGALSILIVRWKRATHWETILELSLIGLWAIFIGREYLNLDPHIWPGNSLYSPTINEFGSAIQPHFVWSLLPQCGTCLLWNGAVNGGAPALADIYGATLHPIVIFTTLVWGAINGAKVTLVASLFMAGVAQWWLARAMQLGRAVRLWSGVLAVVGGHLAGRMEIGIVTLVLSTAACSLVLAPGIDLALTGRRRSAVLFGITLALAGLAGQGYLQVGLLIGVLPAFMIFLIDRPQRVKALRKKFALAALIASLLSAIFWIPTLHFLPNVSKGSDPSFASAQPLPAALANLLIADPAYYTTAWPSGQPVPHLYINYIGLIPILLAVIAIGLATRSHRRLVLFFVIAIGLVYSAATAFTLRLLGLFLPDLISAVRYPSLIAGLGVPLIIGLAAWGLDQLLHATWGARLSSHPIARISAAVVSIVLLFVSLQSAYVFGQSWMNMGTAPQAAYEVLDTIDSSAAQWIDIPFGEHAWTPIGLSAGLKLANAFRPWAWKDRALPPAAIEVMYDPAKTSVTNRFGTTEGILVKTQPQNAYAVIDVGAQRVPCQARAQGGNIDVDCRSETPGTLVVYENNWSGWTAYRDGNPIELSDSPWLSTAAPPGQHHYEFRYRPADVLIGLLISLLGLGVSSWLLWSTRTTP